MYQLLISRLKKSLTLVAFFQGGGYFLYQGHYYCCQQQRSGLNMLLFVLFAGAAVDSAEA